MLNRVAPESEREQAVDRFLTFADAVVAIAITLLALPVLELAPEAVHGFSAWWVAARFPLLGLVISFAVVGRLWWAHHRIWEHVTRVSAVLVWVTFVWLLTIVLLAVSTSLTTVVSPEEEPWRFTLYASVIVVSSALLVTQSVIVLRHPELTDGQDVTARRRVVSGADATLGFVLVLVVGTLLPQLNYFAFFLLAITGRIGGVVNRRLDRRSGRSG